MTFPSYDLAMLRVSRLLGVGLVVSVFGGAAVSVSGDLSRLSDAQLARFMGDDNIRRAGEVRRRVAEPSPPRGFWKMPPDRAALALADAIRSAAHAKEVKLSLDRSGKPPEACQLLYHVRWPHARLSRGRYYFLRCDARRSYLAFGRRILPRHSERGTQARYDLRILDLHHQRARWLARTVWWVTRLRSGPVKRSLRRERYRRTSGDGTGYWRLQSSAGTSLASGSGSLSVFELRTIWHGALGGRERAMLIDRLVEWFTQSLGKPWRGQGLEIDLSRRWQVDRKERTRDRLRLVPVARVFLSLHSNDELRISLPLVRLAGEAAGQLGLVGLRSLTASALRRLPPPPKGRTIAAVERDLERLASHSEGVSPGRRDAQRRRLMAELHGLWEKELGTGR